MAIIKDELEVISAILKTLNGLDCSEKKRVLDYLVGRVEYDSRAKLPSQPADYEGNISAFDR